MNQPKFYYVYILESIARPDHFYTGFTENLRDRLDHHNSGAVPHTATGRAFGKKR
jgi:predicted GIY-YIG superfamily endonuclease